MEQTNDPFASNPLPCHDAAVIKLIGHPLRLRILFSLNEKNCTVKELWEKLGIEQPVVSQQLAILKNLGIVTGRRKGVRMLYQIMHPLAQRIITALTHSDD
jgi:ArsR family transcriptional regulator